MLRKVAIALAIAGTAAGLTALPAQAAKHPDGMDTVGSAHGVVPARGAKAAASRRTANMVFHNGEIMPSARVQAIYWGTSWPSKTVTPNDKQSGLQSFYGGFGDSHYAAASDEYTGTNGTVGSTVTVSDFLVDNSAAPSRAPATSTILAEVSKEITAPTHDGYYPVYIDQPRGSAGYCAWHSAGTVKGVVVQFAFFFKLDGDAGCDPQDTSTGHSEGLAALANVSAHELSEARSDPNNGGWYDQSGQENGDKCAWTFNQPAVNFASNNTNWKLQGEWSNNAYSNGTGYANSSGQKGCLDGN